MKNDKNFNIAQELAQLRDRLDKTEGILDGLIIIDFTGTLLHCNQSAVTMFGYRTPADGIGKKVFTFIHPDHREKVARNMKKVFRKGSGFLSPYIVVKKDGTEFWVESLGHKIAYQGMPAEMIVIRDVTERKRMEIALKDARDQLEVTVEQRTRELKETNRLLRAEIVERKKAEQGLKKGLVKIGKVLKALVSALSSAVEAKDPYTAGHQNHVAKLASAIAEEMKLPPETITGIYLAAVVHDIGKIHIPAEILTKPGKLSSIEVELIRTHARFGYDILKMIDFPWPIARIVYQHHERMNGTGYPERLRGDAILLESRILAVADIVEAISNYRPYRPALGVGSALKELAKNRGILYDKSVVDACTRLFRKKKNGLEFIFQPQPAQSGTYLS